MSHPVVQIGRTGMEFSLITFRDFDLLFQVLTKASFVHFEHDDQHPTFDFLCTDENDYPIDMSHYM